MHSGDAAAHLPQSPAMRARAPVRWLATLVSLVWLLSGVPAQPVHADASSDLETLRAAYTDLYDLFYRRVTPRDLLGPAWAALDATAGRSGAARPSALPTLPDDRDAAFDVFATAYAEYLASAPAASGSTSPTPDLVTGMAEGLHEAHTHYLSPSIMQRFLEAVSGGQQGTGIGVKLGDPPGLITDVAPNGPAARAGVQPGDVVVAADGRDLVGRDSITIGTALSGPLASDVSLTVDRTDGRTTLTVTRGAYYFPPLESRMVSDDVGYIRLSDFVISGAPLPDGTEILTEFDRQLDALDAQGARGLILDLRNNGGGSVQTADEILGRFVPDTTRSIHEFDERGHSTFELASGRVRTRQLPLAVLINRGSASASEVTVGALRDAGRAILVGQRTAGAVASSQVYPLPDGGGLQIAVAAATTADSGTQLDGVGVEPDVVTAEVRTLADYRAGHDPQVDTAIAALNRAPAPPAITPQAPALSSSELDALLGRGLPDHVPTNDRLTSGTPWQRIDFTHPNQLIDQNLGGGDPLVVQAALRSRGYQGTVLATYGAAAGDVPAVSVNLDLYASSAGAHAALTSNDMPQLLTPVDPPLVVGDETAAYTGSWLATGASVITWRRGRVVLTASYTDVPGYDRPDTLQAVVAQTDALAQQLNP